MAQRSQTIALILVTLLLAACSPRAKMCAVCQRDECTGLTFKITLASGKIVETCCPRCAAHYVRGQTAPVRALVATDFATGKPVDGAIAVYVVGGDVSHCAAMEVRRGADGCCLFKDYDRCQPSTLAFATRDEAAEFQKKHGGTLVAWAEVLPR